MNNSAVSKCLQRLGPIYRDPSRVSRDASLLLSSQPGRHLNPSASDLIQNDGSSAPSLVLKGTIPMIYNGTTYNIPIDMYLPSSYPIRPPVVYVRPVASMMIKEGHRHVGQDGMVYMPYLHGWRANSHNLIDAVRNMSDIFGKEPPVFAKPPGYRSSNVNVATATARPARPTPPSYEDVASSNAANGSSTSSTGVSDLFRRFTSMAGSGTGTTSQQPTEEEQIARLAKEAEEANAAVAAARAADAKELHEQKMTEETREKLTGYTQKILRSYRSMANDELSDLTKDQILLRKSREFIGDENEGQMAYLIKRKAELEMHHKELDEGIEQLEAFVTMAKEEKSSKKKVSADELAVPGDIHSAQMLILSAENAAINDALYFLDKKLGDHGISLEGHLRAVRKLAKKQFLLRAHLLKIGQVKASEAIKQSSWR